jgi:hypothetical protein
MKRLCTVATPSLSAEIVALTDGGVFVEGQT